MAVGLGGRLCVCVSRELSAKGILKTGTSPA